MGRLIASLRYKLGIFSLPFILCACAGQQIASGPVDAGYYRVRSGDTLGKIAAMNRQSVRNLAQWNNLANPDRIDVGQVLRVVPPAGTSPTVASGAPATSPSAAMPSPYGGGAVPASSIRLTWPAKGLILTSFNGSSSKGIDIGGQTGEPVVAAAAGKVVYAGHGLRGYGNLIMLKHDSGFLTAYAHNQKLLAKEGDTVRQGQEIAEMGDTDANRVKLHFELRYDGKPLDPMAYLPTR